ncbi:MAG: hypothetical protein JSU72_17100, partial [Deltaproteobacteria bacterium]
VLGRLSFLTFILPVAPSDVEAIKMIAKRGKVALENNLITVSSFLVFTCTRYDQMCHFRLKEAYYQMLELGKSGVIVNGRILTYPPIR